MSIIFDQLNIPLHIYIPRHPVINQAELLQATAIDVVHLLNYLAFCQNMSKDQVFVNLLVNIQKIPLISINSFILG